jgi:hypothetical protein
MKVIAVIECQGVVRQILAHLGLPTTVPGFRGPPAQLGSRVADPPREWSYEPIFDDLFRLTRPPAAGSVPAYCWAAVSSLARSSCADPVRAC